MESEKELTSAEESLQLITRMINQTKRDYRETGISALLWGSVITVCALVTFGNFFWRIKALEYIWLLTIGAVVPQIIISIQESKRRRLKSYTDDLMGGIWISFGMAMFLLSYFTSKDPIPNEASIFMVIYGIPTFATGYSRRFRPMIIGGLACWVFAILSSFSPFPYTMLYTAAAAQLAWFIPGLILRRAYLKAKGQHV